MDDGWSNYPAFFGECQYADTGDIPGNPTKFGISTKSMSVLSSDAVIPMSIEELFEVIKSEQPLSGYFNNPDLVAQAKVEVGIVTETSDPSPKGSPVYMGYLVTGGRSDCPNYVRQVPRYWSVMRMSSSTPKRESFRLWARFSWQMPINSRQVAGDTRRCGQHSTTGHRGHVAEPIID